MTNVAPIVAILGMLALTWLIVWSTLRRAPPPRRPRFQCPVCGGRFWSSGEPFKVARCVGCDFTWKRVDDDRYIGSIDR